MADSDVLRIDWNTSGVARLWLTRGDRHNAFDDELIAQLTDTLRDIASRPDARALVLSGEGASFSAGADVHWMRRMAAASEHDNRLDSEKLAALMRTLNDMPIPTLARVHGAALGGGVGLVACCDLAIATPAAKFGLTEVKLGLVPAVISPYVIDAIGQRWARRLFVTGELFDATLAKHIGLVQEVVEPEALDSRIDQLLGWITKAGPNAVREAKHLVHRVAQSSGAERDQLDRDNAALIAKLRVSSEGQEGLTAFLDKRTPHW